MPTDPRIPLDVLCRLVLARLQEVVEPDILVVDISEDPPSAEPGSDGAPAVPRWCRLASVHPSTLPRRSGEGDAHEQTVAITVSVGASTDELAATPNRAELDADTVAAALDGQTLRDGGVTLLIRSADAQNRSHGEHAAHQVIPVTAIGWAQKPV